MTPPRSRFRLVALLLPTLLLFSLPGCTTTEPMTGRSQFIMVPFSQEVQLGREAWSEVLKTEKPGTNRTQIEMVERVGRNLSQVVVEEGYEWEFRLLESEDANAFCLPGGKIAVYSGLFEYARSEAELAAVVGHEIAHATARHGAERMTQGMLVNLGATALTLMLNDKPRESRARWMAAYAGISTVGFILPYSRKHEYAADEIGLMYMARAGYDPGAAVRFWERFSEGKPSGGIAEFLSTHPVGPKRIENLRRLMSKAQVEYDMAPQRRGEGTRLTR